MRTRLVPTLLWISLLSVAALQAQAPGAPAAGLAQGPPSGSTELHTGAELVVVDVVVQDKNGQPIRNLPRSAFQITENKTPQTIGSFEEHSSANVKIGPSLPKMPPGTFTDYTPVPEGGALNVLLVDALNTPMQDQSFLRQQLQQYVKSLPPGTRLAIFGLNTRLYFLQGFTSDLETLKDAVDHKLIPRASNLMDNPVDGTADTSLSDSVAESGVGQAQGLSQIASNLVQFESMQQSYQQQLRIQYTLDAFNNLGHYLAAFPGRKNVLWFSGSFPIDILPDPSLDNPFATLELNDEEFRETTNLLTRAQVAVYPIDARGLMTNPAFSASQSGRAFARDPSAAGNSEAKFLQSQALEHTTMEQLATDTGGRAYYNTNGLAAAAANAIDSGANYYTLSYTPTDRDPHGEYREIRLSLTNDYAAKGFKLYYRHGYYANDPKHPANTAGSAATAATQKAAADRAGAAYFRAVMSRGAPAPQDILFKVRVLPLSTTTDTALLPTDKPDAAAPFKAPFRRYSIDFAAVGSEIHLIPQADGTRTGAVEFAAFLFDNDGKLLNAVGKTVQMHLGADKYAELAHSGIGLRLEISAPARGESFLRLAVHDLTTNRFGVVELPISAVSRLLPAQVIAPASAAPGKTPPAPSTPSTAATPSPAPH